METTDISEKAMIIWDVLLDIDFENKRLISSYQPSSFVSFKEAKLGEQVFLLLDADQQTITIDQTPITPKAGAIRLPANFINKLNTGNEYIQRMAFTDERCRPFLTTWKMRARLNGELPTVSVGTIDYFFDMKEERLLPADGRGRPIALADFELVDMGDDAPMYVGLFDSVSRKLVDQEKGVYTISPETYQVWLPDLNSLDPVGYAQHKYGTWPHVFLKAHTDNYQGWPAPKLSKAEQTQSMGDLTRKRNKINSRFPAKKKGRRL